jgi:hypothetical protein
MWSYFSQWDRKHTIFSTWCPFPVDYRILQSAILTNIEERQYKGPYPLHDLATLLKVSHKDPTGDYPRNEIETERHNPISAAHQCNRLFCENLAELNNRNPKEVNI